MVTLIIGSQILKAFCVVFGICARGGSREIVLGGPKDSSPMPSCKPPLYNIKWCLKKIHNHYDYNYYYLVIGNILRTG